MLPEIEIGDFLKGYLRNKPNAMNSLEKLHSSQTLDTLTRGQRATVSGVNCGNAELRNKLLSMGLVEGTSVEVSRVAPLGDPIDIRVLGFNLSLRLAEAASVVVER